ncbi:Fcf1-domain-containing protein, partial [Cokeromyces recurvatus]|uniref:Fcf1-domain-containing protein n=1 Tax=Cokeromyces recurvatus TaxID=90255 RepID=UPI00221F99B6
KESRTNKKIVHTYSIGFGFRPPYQILLDGEFCKVALDRKIYLKDALPSLMFAPTRLLVTECILNELKSKGHDHTSAYILAKKFETRKCSHKEQPVSSYQCIREAVGDDNKHHLSIATQNPKLKDRLRKIPGVPIIYVNVKHQRLGIEPMTDRSKQVMKQHELEKTQPVDKMTLQLKRKVLANEGDEHQQKPKPKKRKVKGVNPLAMKKKK